ncbi:hypothetical protein PybrP1_008581 [[Pythium] brassicae (nom. inval.)]|nr:hypothetical protein PybrP1_008581 [[Pythium] brassicae (nom. inval.)]
MVTAVVEYIKPVKHSWPKVEVFVIDKDVVEWRVLERSFSSAKAKDDRADTRALRVIARLTSVYACVQVSHHEVHPARSVVGQDSSELCGAREVEAEVLAHIALGNPPRIGKRRAEFEYTSTSLTLLSVRSRLPASYPRFLADVQRVLSDFALGIVREEYDCAAVVARRYETTLATRARASCPRSHLSRETAKACCGLRSVVVHVRALLPVVPDQHGDGARTSTARLRVECSRCAHKIGLHPGAVGLREVQRRLYSARRFRDGSENSPSEGFFSRIEELESVVGQAMRTWRDDSKFELLPVFDETSQPEHEDMVGGYGEGEPQSDDDELDWKARDESPCADTTAHLHPPPAESNVDLVPNKVVRVDELSQSSARASAPPAKSSQTKLGVACQVGKPDNRSSQVVQRLYLPGVQHHGHLKGAVGKHKKLRLHRFAKSSQTACSVNVKLLLEWGGTTTTSRRCGQASTRTQRGSTRSRTYCVPSKLSSCSAPPQPAPPTTAS